MMRKTRVLLVATALLAVSAVGGHEAPAFAQEGEEGKDAAETAERSAAGEAPEPEASPTPATRSFTCAVDAPDERCTVPISDKDHVEGVVAYRQETTGKWVDYGRGPFNREDQPDGCGWVLQFRERLVEERGCFQAGKRHGEWETCQIRLDQQEAAAGARCPKTEYDMGVIVVKPKEPEPELVGEAEADETADETASGDEGKSAKKSK